MCCLPTALLPMFLSFRATSFVTIYALKMPKNNWSAHHATMKLTAQSDWEKVRRYCENNQIMSCHPTGEHWHKIEDATAQMLKLIGHKKALTLFDLNRGV